MFFMTVTILCLFASAFFTDVIGVHAIFGTLLVLVLVELMSKGDLGI
jgi:Kef-type K+ transport system membrane component KefB